MEDYASRHGNKRGVPGSVNVVDDYLSSKFWSFLRECADISDLRGRSALADAIAWSRIDMVHLTDAVFQFTGDVITLRKTHDAFRATGGNASQAAKILDITRSGLHVRLKTFGFSADDFRDASRGADDLIQTSPRVLNILEECVNAIRAVEEGLPFEWWEEERG